MQVKLNSNRFQTPKGATLMIEAADLPGEIYVSAGWREDYLFLTLPIYTIDENEMEVIPPVVA